MKFLGWMHRKSMHNGTEHNKKSTTGNLPACFSVQTLFDGQNKTRICSNIKGQKSANRFEANKGEVNLHEESIEPFEFLAIGTLGMELINTDPPTPTLSTPFENWTNPQIEITEKDLKIINYELEKFLEGEEKDNVNDKSGRTSQASIITLSHKPSEEADSEGKICTMACPLQNSLFATLIEHTQTEEVKKEKTSLEGLFKENNIDRDDPIKIREGAEQELGKKNVANFMKKVVKKLHSSPSFSKAASKNDAALSISVKKNLCKMQAVKMFHRKVHPEEMTQKQFATLQKSCKIEISHEDSRQIRGYNENKMIGQGGSKRSEKSNTKLSSTNNGEHWIKTDSDYLVLEL